MAAKYFGDTALVRPQSDGTFKVSFSATSEGANHIISLAYNGSDLAKSGNQYTVSIPKADSDTVVPISMTIKEMEQLGGGAQIADMHLKLSRPLPRWRRVRPWLPAVACSVDSAEIARGSRKLLPWAFRLGLRRLRVGARAQARAVGRAIESARPPSAAILMSDRSVGIRAGRRSCAQGDYADRWAGGRKRAAAVRYPRCWSAGREYGPVPFGAGPFVA